MRSFEAAAQVFKRFHWRFPTVRLSTIEWFKPPFIQRLSFKLFCVMTFKSHSDLRFSKVQGTLPRKWRTCLACYQPKFANHPLPSLLRKNGFHHHVLPARNNGFVRPRVAHMVFIRFAKFSEDLSTLDCRPCCLLSLPCGSFSAIALPVDLRAQASLALTVDRAHYSISSEAYLFGLLHNVTP